MKQSLRPDTVWNLSLAIAMIFFTASLAVAFMPKPTDDTIADTYRKQLKTHEIKANLKKMEAAKLQAANVVQLWTGDAETIGARSLNNISRTAKVKGVRLSAFRPQRPIQAAELEQLPFLTIVEGKYPAVVSFIRALEHPSWKLATGSVQIAATDGTSDNVSASIVLVAFRDPSVKVEEKNGTSK